MQYKDSKVSKNGFRAGDFVLTNKANASYGRVVKIEKIFAEATDWIMKYSKYGVSAGQELNSNVTVETVIRVNLNTPKKKTRCTMDESKVTLVNKNFVSKLFKELNNKIAYVKMINEQEGLV